MEVVKKFITHRANFFTIQDLMDEVGHEIQMYREQMRQTKAPLDKEIALLRMLKSDLRNIVKRYQKLEELLQ